MRFRTLLGALALLPVALCSAACSVNVKNDNPPAPTSSALATNQMWPSMSAQCDGQTLKVYAAVLQSSNFVLLDTGDFFTASVAGGAPVVMTQEPNTPGKIHYIATFPAPAAAADVVITFNRPAGKTGATSKVTVPAPFQITSPAPTGFKIGDPLALAISPPPEANVTTMVNVTGSCLQDLGPVSVKFDVNGHATFNTTQLKFAPGSTTGCDVGVQIANNASGDSDAAYLNASTNPLAADQARYFTTALLR